MNNTFDKLNDIFNVGDVKPRDYSVQKIEESNPDKKESDFDLARDTLRDLIAKNNTVLEDIISIARSSESARSFEVAGQLIKAQSEIAKDLMTLHKQKKEVSGESQDQKIQQQNNIVFAGSTADLMKMISAQKAKTVDSKE
jgi:hypothetical protein